ncbi:unnamed protein product, partial [Clonostachys chloroleuca]
MRPAYRPLFIFLEPLQLPQGRLRVPGRQPRGVLPHSLRLEGFAIKGARPSVFSEQGRQELHVLLQLRFAAVQDAGEDFEFAKPLLHIPEDVGRRSAG